MIHTQLVATHFIWEDASEEYATLGRRTVEVDV